MEMTLLQFSASQQCQHLNTDLKLVKNFTTANIAGPKISNNNDSFFEYFAQRNHLQQ